MTHNTHQCPSPWQCQKEGEEEEEGLWDLLREGDLFTFVLFLAANSFWRLFPSLSFCFGGKLRRVGAEAKRQVD